MGRPERPLDRDAGPVPAFADELRKLRRKAGSPSYRVLAARANYSHTVLSDATRGERLPTLAVTLAFVRACGGDPAEWEVRWHLHRQLAEGLLVQPAANTADLADTVDAAAADTVASGTSASAMDATSLEGAAPPAHGTSDRTAASVPGGTPPGRPPGTRPIGGIVRHAAVAAVVAVLAGTCGWWLRPATSSAPAAATGPSAPASAQVDDGTDPKVAGCTTDAYPRDNIPVRLDRPARLHSRVLPAGTQVGTVYLIYSVRCAGAWARFAPTPGLNPDPNETSAASVSVQVDRPIDGTSSLWRMGHVDSMYSNLLLVGVGCVTAGATVRMTGQDAVGSAHTKCLGRP
ncbi:helix-turn-helix domain-containing protein [Actinomadura oligospora]|uniref:helix-turn-helix domain-containing protein n=1 Tax=Actinomadura oligospora TaxID=111804 RepID=UPI000686175B|nr:helix-turn-helix transcriptional regulator [Actinomadura oligospora]